MTTEDFKYQEFGFLLKIILLSALLSVFIKYIGSLLPSYGSQTDFQSSFVLMIVLTPSAVIGSILLLVLLTKRRSS